MQRIRPDNRFDTALKGIEQDHHEDDQRRHPKRYVQAIENGVLQNPDDEIQTRRGAERARQDKKTGTGFIGARPHPGIKIMVDRGQVHPVINRQEHKRDHEIAQQLADDDLKISERRGTNRARNADEGHAAKRSTDHAEGNEHPVAFTVADKK